MRMAAQYCRTDSKHSTVYIWQSQQSQPPNRPETQHFLYSPNSGWTRAPASDACFRHRRRQGPPVDNQLKGDEHADHSYHIQSNVFDGLHCDRINRPQRLYRMHNMLISQGWAPPTQSSDTAPHHLAGSLAAQMMGAFCFRKISAALGISVRVL